MKRFLYSCLMALTFGFPPSPALAQDTLLPGLRTNGCGAANGWSSKLVPNKALLGYCQFEDSCKKHDVCYGRCLEGGELFGQPECNDAPGSPAKKQRQMLCDAALGADIVAFNKGKPVCSFYSSLYQWAVEQFGQNSFSGIGEGEPAFAVIREFLNYASKHPEVYSDQDQALLLSALGNMAQKPNDKFVAKFDRFSGRFTLAHIVDGKTVTVVTVPQEKRNDQR